MQYISLSLSLLCYSVCWWYTDDHNRVRLKQFPGREGSDYINASYIDVS